MRTKLSPLFLPAALLACALSSAAQQPMQEQTLLRSKPDGQFMLGVVAGTQAAVSDRAKQGMWLGAMGGLSLRWQAGSRWSLQADALVREVQGYGFNMEYQVSGLTALGSTWSYYYSASGDGLRFIEFPILLKRATSDRQRNVFLGIRPARIFTLDEISSFGASSLQVDPLSYYVPSYEMGFRRWDMALTIGFEAHLSHHLWLDARYSQGLLDLTHDDFFRNTATDVSSDAQLTLRYYFWRF